MLGTNLAALDDVDKLVQAFEAGDDQALMEATGQSTGGNRQVGLPRININYDAEDEDGKPLTRGEWKMMYEGKMVYAPSVDIQILLRTYEYSVWDQETGSFSNKSVQKTLLSGDFPDSLGGNKCGRLTRDEEDALSKDDPAYLHSRSVVCNQVIYGKLTGDFVDADGNGIQIKDQPIISYFKRSGFKPVADFIDTLNKQKKVMQKCIANFSTQKNKKGSVTYWTPAVSFAKTTDIKDADKDLMRMFGDTVKAHNETITNQYREAVKMVVTNDESDLASDFVDVHTT
jgi:hypothetical protein|tara:strand:- start:533 stop:1390 length:858 start_codon:yes stop_codon:yes gene_type:complete